ncbi:MAG: metallophosphoesterase family protein, partial [Gemmatimonadales bacterium]
MSGDRAAARIFLTCVIAAGALFAPACSDRADLQEPEPPPEAPAPPEEPAPPPEPAPPEEPAPPPPPPPPPPPAAEIFVGAGDIAGCTARFHDEATAALLDEIEGTVFALGDNVQGSGTAEDFANCYHPVWGRHKARTWPAVGNHEYNVPGAEPHFEYWGTRAGPAGKGYYSYDLGEWHIVVLNSNVLFAEQNEWLAADLAANPRECTLAYWHHPWFTSSAYRGREELLRFVEILHEAGADVVLTGHAHGYERFAPQTPAGALDEERGIRHFVVGTGGAPFHPFTQTKPNSEVRELAYGLLKMELYPDRYTWEFVPVEG